MKEGGLDDLPVDVLHCQDSTSGSDDESQWAKSWKIMLYLILCKLIFFILWYTNYFLPYIWMDYTLPWPPHSRPHNISAFNIWALWLNYNIWALWLNYNIWASCSILQYLGLMFSTSYRDHKKSSIHIMIMYYVGIIEI